MNEDIRTFKIKTHGHGYIEVIEYIDGSIQAGKYLFSPGPKTVLYDGAYLYDFTPSITCAFTELLRRHESGFPSMSQEELAEKVRPGKDDDENSFRPIQKARRKPLLRECFRPGGGRTHKSWGSLFKRTNTVRGSHVYLDLSSPPSL